MRPRSSPLQLDLFPPGTEPSSPRAVSPPPASAAPERVPDRAAGREDGLASLEGRLAGLLGGELRSLTFTDNRSRIVSASPAPGGGLAVRIHRSFAGAPNATVEAVASFLSERRPGPRRRQALGVIREHFARHGPGDPPSKPRPRRLVLSPVGSRFDLRELRDELNHVYFRNRLEVHVTWGRRPAGRKTSRHRKSRGVSIRLGTYNERRRLVRIHRCLDHPRVPRYVVGAVLYHEMLHAALPVTVVNGRRRIHTPEFRRRERLFADHEKADRWIAENLRWLSANR